MGRVDRKRKKKQKVQELNTGKDSTRTTGKVVENNQETYGSANQVHRLCRRAPGMEKGMACTAPLRFEILHQLLAGRKEYAKMALLEDKPMPPMPNT